MHMSTDERMTFRDVTGELKREREIQIDYTNHRGERRWRRIIPEEKGIYWGTSPDHPKPGWLLPAHCCEKGARRTFSMRDIHGVKVEE